MKFAAPVFLSCMAAVLLASCGCDYLKPAMYVDIANRSGHPMENLEVNYPAGTFGLPELRDGQTHRHLVSIAAPCKFSITFEDQTGKTYVRNDDFGAKCPAEVAFEVGTGMSVSQRVVRP